MLDVVKALWEDVGFELSLCTFTLTAIPSILIRQAKDPFVADVQYIAYSKTTLDERGRLDMRNLGLALVLTGDSFVVTCVLHRP